MSNLLTKVRRSLTEDPDLAVISGLRHTPPTGWCFLYHEDAGFLKARRMGKTHWELIYDWVSKQFPNLSPRVLQSLTDVERLKVKWSGRWWEENDTIYVSFWEHEKYLPTILQLFGEEAPINMSEAMYQCWDNTEDEWLTLSEVTERNPTVAPLPTANPIMARKIVQIRTELHTATPERKALLRQMLRILDPSEATEEPVEHVSGRAGFRSPVEMNYARRQESTSRPRFELGSAWMSPFGELTMVGIGETHASLIWDGDIDPGDMEIEALEAWATENQIDTDDDYTWPVDAAIKLGWCRLKHARAINSIYIVSQSVPSGLQRKTLKAIHDDYGIRVLIDTSRGEPRSLFESEKDKCVSTKGLKQNFDGVSLKQDNRGFYVTTHRCRSKSYATAAKIPQSVIDYIESTG